MTRKNGWASLEFVGLPGVGKSTLSHRVAELLQRRGWPVEQPTYSADHEMRAWQRQLLKVRLVSAEAVLHPGRTATSIRAILATRQAGALDLIRVAANWLFVSSLLRQAQHREALYIFDEGLVGALWSIGFSARSTGTGRVLQELARQRPTPVVVAVMEADVETIAQRLRRRKDGDSRLERTVPIRDGWERGLRALQQIKATLQTLIDEGVDIRLAVVQDPRPEDLANIAAGLASTVEGLLTYSGARRRIVEGALTGSRGTP